jgi:hypothetical protein
MVVKVNISNTVRYTELAVSRSKVCSATDRRQRKGHPGLAARTIVSALNV